MKAGWEYKALGDVCDVIGGGTPAKDNEQFYLNGTISWATVRDMKSDIITDTEFKITDAAVSTSSTNVISKGNIVIATRVGLGKACLLAQDTAINQDLKGVIPKDPARLMVGYLFQWFKNNAQVIIDEGTGATVQGVKLPFIKSLIIPIPPIEEQQRIVAILDEAFEGIAIAKSNAEKNLQNARTLFESHLQAVFLERGEGWVSTTLENACTKILAGGDVPKGRVSAERTSQYGVPIFSNGAKDKGLYGFTDFASVMQPSVTISARGTIGFSAIRTEPFLPVVRLIVLIPDEKAINVSFLHYAVMGMDFGNTGTSIPQLTVPNLKERRICIPPLEQQWHIVANLDAVCEETQRLESIYQQKLDSLDALKKSLLDQAFSGKL